MMKARVAGVAAPLIDEIERGAAERRQCRPFLDRLQSARCAGNSASSARTTQNRPRPTSAMCNPAMASTCARPASRKRGFVFLGDAAAVAGDQRRGDGAGAARQHRMDARRHAPAQNARSSAGSAPPTLEARSGAIGVGRAIGVAHRADLTEEGGAAEIVIARRGRCGGGISTARMSIQSPGFSMLGRRCGWRCAPVAAAPAWARCSAPKASAPRARPCRAALRSRCVPCTITGPMRCASTGAATDSVRCFATANPSSTAADTGQDRAREGGRRFPRQQPRSRTPNRRAPMPRSSDGSSGSAK